MLNGFVAAILIAFAVIARPHAEKTKPVETFWLHSSAQVIGENHSLTLTCHVPRHEDNRWVEIGIEGYTASTVEMEGENSPKTFQILFKRVPCGIGAAYCNVGGIPGSHVTSTKLPVLVSGCEQ